MRVLLMTQNILLGDALESILSQALNLLVHRLQFTNADDLWQATNDYQPEVIILEEGIICQSSLFLPSQWEDNGRLCLILVNPEINRIHIHNKFQVSLTRAADFIALVENYPRQWPNAAAAAAYTVSSNANAP